MIDSIKPIKLSQHVLENLLDRGTSKAEIENAIRTGERLPAKKEDSLQKKLQR